jgi:tRNA(adenine34) deaminase
MHLAIEASAAALTAGNLPFGAVLVKGGAVLGIAQNNAITTGDGTGHAETVLVRDAFAAHGPSATKGATVYASGEPCAMCSGAMFWTGIVRVVFAATQADIIAALPDVTLPIRSAQILAEAKPRVSVEGEFERAAAVAVLQRFATLRRGMP